MYKQSNYNLYYIPTIINSPIFLNVFYSITQYSVSICHEVVENSSTVSRESYEPHVNVAHVNDMNIAHLSPVLPVHLHSQL